MVVSGAGFEAWDVLLQGGGYIEQAPRCHPHPASSCEPKEWLVCNYVWHSSHCCTVCSVVAQELAPTPGQTEGLKSTLPLPSAKWWNSGFYLLYPELESKNKSAVVCHS